MRKSVIFVLGLFFLWACNANSEKNEEGPQQQVDETLAVLNEEQISNANIVTAQPTWLVSSPLLRLNGLIDVPPKNRISVSVPMGGYLKSADLLPGARVRKGQVLATLEDQQYIQLQQQYLEGKNRLVFLEKEFLRQQELSKTQAASQKMAQQAEADYQSQRIANKSLYERLKMVGVDPDKLALEHISRTMTVRSPINGFVSQANMTLGKYVSPTDVLFELVDPSDIHLNLKVFEKDLERLQIGQRIQAFTNNDPGTLYNCKVILIGKDFSPERTVELHAHFEKYDPDLVPGTYMNAEVRLKDHRALTLPEDAVVSYQGQTYVFVPQLKGQYRMLPVTVGSLIEGRIEVLNPELADKTVVVQGAYALLMYLKNKSED
ncbi:cobalt-zinc-cadmium efflux system membrane fusion protein [Dyadobacter jejuensis]|uniref:Cobalt-zinc-cadmium efflux system membrane fusion protein n=1 Tax=Dyadobacter jejuensis TaxID=1082580 RepID=A0A316ADZ8_9BACT|nr:efflux RND transporter periplasmic adaptor subunit [Dyadobacter jejuensis]PWJ55973.1 cobalt-zinc-cadmium efflux system membrane fusion protein [Dyadobacter jejuensis]